MKILIIRLSSFGDILLTFPIINFLKKKFPNAEIDYLVKKEYEEVFSLYPEKINLILFDKDSGFRGLQKMKKSIKNNKYDIILDLHNNLRSIYLRMFQKAKKGVFRKHSFRKQLLVKLKVNLYKNILSIKERYLHALGKIIDITSADTKDIMEFRLKGIPADSFNEDTKFIKEGDTKLIGFCPSAKHYTKRYPAEKFIELGKTLIENYGAKIFLFGDEKDFRINEIIKEGIGTNIFNVSGKCSLSHTAYLMTMCDLIITNDSGLMHLANLLDKNLISIFGSTVKEFGFFPTGENVSVIEINNLKCRPCSHIGRSKCPIDHFKCMNEIKINDILTNSMNIL